MRYEETCVRKNEEKANEWETDKSKAIDLFSILFEHFTVLLSQLYFIPNLCFTCSYYSRNLSPWSRRQRKKLFLPRGGRRYG